MTQIRTTLRSLPNLVQTRLLRIERRVAQGLMHTSEAAVRMIRKRAPRAFGPLRDSVHSVPRLQYSRGLSAAPMVHAKTIVDAPHAAGIERGTTPHTPNFERLLAWVKLRGMQGLTEKGRLRSRYGASSRIGPTTALHARNVSRRLKNLEVRRRAASPRKGRDANGRYLPTDAAVQVARAISMAIQKKGTRPQWFVRRSITEIAAEMGRRVRVAVKQ